MGIPVSEILRKPDGLKPAHTYIEPRFLYSINHPKTQQMTAREILATQEEADRVVIMPIANIRRNPNHVDNEKSTHIKKLIESSSSGYNGQHTPINLWTHIDEATGEVVTDISDGNHRLDAIIALGRDEIMATEYFGWTREKFAQEQIAAAAKSSKTVQYARTCDYIKDYYSRTPWAREGFSFYQIVSLAYNKELGIVKEPGKNTDFGDMDPTHAIIWAEDLAIQWEIKLSRLHRMAYIISHADPDLIAQVRNTGGGHDGKGVLSSTRLEQLVPILPGRENFELQRFAVDLILKHNFVGHEAKFLAMAIKEAHWDRHRLQDIQEDPAKYIADYEQQELRAHNGKLKRRRTRVGLTRENQQLQKQLQQVTEHATQLEATQATAVKGWWDDSLVTKHISADARYLLIETIIKARPEAVVVEEAGWDKNRAHEARQIILNARTIFQQEQAKSHGLDLREDE